MALIIAIVSVIFFQSFLTNIVSDAQSGVSIDEYTQMQGERLAIERIVKEAVLEFYEEQYVKDGKPAHDDGELVKLINTYLDAMKGSGASTFTLTAHDALPDSFGTSRLAFWPNLTLNTAATPAIIATTMDQGGAPGTYKLAKVNLDGSGRSTYRRVSSFMPDYSEALQVQRNDTSATDNFAFTVTRATSGVANHVYTVYLRLYQVPVTDFGLISYAIANSKTSIPDAPADLTHASTSIADGVADRSIRALCMSKMATSLAGGTVNTLNDNSGLLFPYAYREQFSASSLLWEYVCYVREYMDAIVPMSTPYTGPGRLQDITLYRIRSLSQTGVMEGATENQYNIKSIDNYERNGAGAIQYKTDAYGNVVKDGLGNPIPKRYARDVAFGTVGPWTIDLNNVPDDVNTTAATIAKDAYRRIYVTAHGNAADMDLVIKDSATGAGVRKPVLIWINGWSVTDSTGASNTTVYLDGDLSDQDILIYGAGVTIRTRNNAKVKGAILLDDVSATLVSDDGTDLALNGTLVWKNGANTPPALGKIVFTPGVSDTIRAVAPRFLLVDARSSAQF
jgi:hypothetical protein